MQKSGVICRSVPCSRMPPSMMGMPGTRMCATTTSASSRPAAAAKYIHNEVADGDDYSCDGVYDGNEYLRKGRRG